MRASHRRLSQKQWEKQIEALLELAEELAAQEEPAVDDAAQLAMDAALLLWPGFSPDQIIRSLQASLAAGTPLIAPPADLEKAMGWSRSVVRRGLEELLEAVRQE
jgi:hypothetical protein